MQMNWNAKAIVRHSDTKVVVRHSDTWVGLALVIVGAIASWRATGFDVASRNLPMMLGFLMVVFGVLLVRQVVTGKARHLDLSIPIRVTVVTAVTAMVWIGAITIGLGYLLPTFAMQFAFLLSCGVRDLGKAATIAALIASVSYLGFIAGLGLRIPASVAPWLI